MALSTAGAIGISSAINTLAGAGNALANGNMNSKNRKWQTSEREASQRWQDEQTKRNWQYQKDYYDWEMSQYTSPAAQMRLLKEAGLNPDLVYQNGPFQSVSSASAGSPSVPSAPTPASHAYDSAFNQIGASSDAIARSALTDSERKLNESKAGESDSVIRLNDAKVNLTDAQSDWTKEDRQRIISQTENLQALTNKVNSELDNLVADTRLKNASADEKQRIVSEMEQTFKTRFDTLKWQERRSFVELGIKENEWKFVQETFDASVSKFLNEAISSKHIKDLNFWKVFDEQLRHKQSYDSNGKLSSPVQTLLECTVAMATANSAMLEKNLDILKKYKDAHEILNLSSELLTTLSQALGLDFLKSITPRISAF